MKLRQIGLEHAPILEGVVLAPEEYESHPCYHPFLSISSPTLFVSVNGQRWASVVVNRANEYALLDATDNERRLLVENGYRMVNLHVL